MNKSKSVTVYICTIDWQHELGEVSDWTKVYSTVEDLKRQHTCWETCGITEVEVSFSKVIHKQDIFRRSKEDYVEPEIKEKDDEKK